MPRHGLPALAASLAALALVAGGCIHADLAAGVLTPDTGHPEDVYHLDVRDDGVIVASADAANTGGNTRWAFWRKADQPQTDQQICTTWVEGDISTIQQQGAALQIRKEGNRTRAITVTRHIFRGFGGQFNVHVMDSAPPGAPEPRLSWLGGVIVESLADETTPYPWRLCARIVDRTVSFVVWPLPGPQPDWGTPGAGGSVALPADWDAAAGVPGFCVGHLTAGESVGYTDVVISTP
jgi:hypothetical protein